MLQIKKFLSSLDFKSIIILVLIFVLLLTRMCSSPTPNAPTVKVDGKKYEVVKHTVDTVLVPHNTTVYKPGKTIYKETTIYVNVPSKINKDSIVKEYYGKVIYKDTLHLGKNEGYVSITDTVSQNKIVGRVWGNHINTTIIKDNTIVKELPRTQIYVGGMLGGDKSDPINFIGPAILVKTKQDHIYTLAAGYGDNGTLSVQVGLFWKIKLHK